MASDTVTKKTRLLAGRPPRSSFDKLMDVYWGGSERRITGLTLRIIGINSLAVLILMLGALNFGQYETKIIKNALENFHTQAQLINSTISVAITEQPNALNYALLNMRGTTDDEILVIEGDQIIASTLSLDKLLPRFYSPPHETNIITFDDIAHWFIRLIPNRDPLPQFPTLPSGDANIFKAAKVSSALMAWRLNENDLLLSASFPILSSDRHLSVFILRSGQHVLNEVSYFWHQIFSLFLMTLALTTLLSIYLSGLIARPLRRLSRTAEQIRRHKTRAIEIPDFSDRHDEIGELSLVMRDMTESLWQRIDSIEQFAADVAHELKNPLTSLKSAVETLSITKKKSDQEKLLKILQHDIERMDRLITDISQASRLDAELSREQQDHINLSQILRDITARYQSMYQDRYHIDLIIPDDKNLYVSGTEGRINQVLDNIIDNALSFSEHGQRVTISGFNHGNSVKIIVDDQGPGIAQGKLTTIFDRFYSQRRKTDNFGQHSGLGLAICKQIVEAMGGTIYAENKPNASGARFIVTL